MFFVIIIGTFILEPLFGIAVFVILPIVMFLQYLQMTVEWESFIKNKSAEKTESEIMLGDAINNFKTVQSFGHEDMIVGHYQDLLEPARASGLRTALCNATIVGFSNFFLTAQQSVLNLVMIELVKSGKIKDPGNSFKVITVILNLTQEMAGKLLSIAEVAKGLAAFEIMNGIFDKPSKIDAITMDEEEE